MKIPTKDNRSPLTLALYALAKRRGYNTDTVENRNLIKLREYLAGLPEGYSNFSMGTFARNLSDPSVIKEGACGTPACVVGHGPSAGIPVEQDIAVASDIDWMLYSRNFLPSGKAFDGGTWEYLFGGFWPDSIPLALERMDYWLVHQVTPVWWDTEAQYRLDNTLDHEEVWDYLEDICGTELPNPYN